MNEQGSRQPGQIQRLSQNQNSRPKIQNGHDGNTNIILPGQTYVGNSRNKQTRQTGSTVAAVGNISELPYSNIDMKQRNTASRNTGLGPANTV